MAKKGQDSVPTSGEARQRPIHKILYLLVKGASRTYWMKYGVGFVNRDNSINIKLDLIPDQQFQLRDADQDEAASQDG